MRSTHLCAHARSWVAGRDWVCSNPDSCAMPACCSVRRQCPDEKVVCRHAASDPLSHGKHLFVLAFPHTTLECCVLPVPQAFRRWGSGCVQERRWSSACTRQPHGSWSTTWSAAGTSGPLLSIGMQDMKLNREVPAHSTRAVHCACPQCCIQMRGKTDAGRFRLLYPLPVPLMLSCLIGAQGTRSKAGCLPVSRRPEHARRCSLRATVDAGLAESAADGHLDAVAAAKDEQQPLGDPPCVCAAAHNSTELARRLLAAAAAGAAPLPEDSMQRLAAAAGWQWQPRRRPAVKRSRIARTPAVRSMRATFGTPYPRDSYSAETMCGTHSLWHRQCTGMQPDMLSVPHDTMLPSQLHLSTGGP